LVGVRGGAHPRTHQQRKGEARPLEEKYGVDLVLRLADYDTCISLYGNNTCDAVCITNTDAIPVAFGRPTVAILATSTSNGADALLGLGYVRPEEPGAQGGEAKKVADFLKGKTVYGLEKSVSEYAFYRGLEKLGLNPDQYKFANMDPGAAATAIQQGQKDAIITWNPFVLQTLRSQTKAKRVFDSRLIPGEIVDMVGMGRDSLNKPGGKEAAKCIAAAYYGVCNMLEDPSVADEVYFQLGEQFSSLSAGDMKQCCEETKFYSKPEAGKTAFTSSQFKEGLNKVVEFQIKKGSIKDKPTTKQIEFSTEFMETYDK
jgi:ABC-type nitrate/sulfonate/bicarbonate transport system substrate-binding protein